MKKRIILSAFIIASIAVAPLSAQNPSAAATDPKPSDPRGVLRTHIEEWIAVNDGQWQAVFKRDVVGMNEAELNQVKLQFLTTLEDAIKRSSAMADLEVALALRNEQKRFAGTNVFLEQDDVNDAPQLKAIRAAFRVKLAKVESDRAARSKTLHGRYDNMLAQAQAALTRNGRLDDALLVKTKRTEVAEMWLTRSTPKKTLPPAPAASQPLKASVTAPPPLAPPASVKPPATPPASQERVAYNPIVNGTFVSGKLHWKFLNSTSSTGRGRMTVDTVERHNGHATLRLDHLEGDNRWVAQEVPVKPNTWYRLSAYVKTKDVKNVIEDRKSGATLCMGMGFMPKPVEGTTDWTKVSVDFKTRERSTANVGPTMGAHNCHVTGTAWFSELRLEEFAPPREE